MYRLTKDKFLSQSEQATLKTKLSNDRNSLLIKLALATGARASELLNIEVRDIDQAEQTVYIRGLKGSNDRDIPLSDKLFQELIAYVNALLFPDYDVSLKLFPFTYIRLTQIWSKFKPSDKSFHSLRHTFAVELYKKQPDIKLVQQALGHRNLRNTMIYSEFLYDKQTMRRLMLG